MGGLRGVAGFTLPNDEVDSVPLGVYRCIMQARRTTRARSERGYIKVETYSHVWVSVCLCARVYVYVTELGSVYCCYQASPRDE